MRTTKKHVYDGHEVVVHKVRRGETLSGIAVTYGFKSWWPIWIFNTDVKHVLSGSPNDIQEGCDIFIPRSEKGYDALIQNLRTLRNKIESRADEERYELEAQENLLKARMVVLDAISDAATSLVSIGLQAKHAAGVAKAALKLKGSERIAGEYLAKKEGEKLIEMAGEKVMTTALDGSVKLATKDMGDEEADKIGDRWEHAKASYKGTKAVRNFSMVRGRFLLDIADILADLAKPSKIALLWFKLVDGGSDPKKIADNVQESIKRETAIAAAKLHEKVKQAQAECDLLYKSSRPDPLRPGQLDPGIGPKLPGPDAGGGPQINLGLRT